MLEAYKISSIDWKPSPVLALATSVDGCQVAAARDDGSLEIWLVSPGSVGWNCQLTIYGDPKRRISSLVWCHSRLVPSGRLFSSCIDGSVSEWDLFNLRQKNVLDSNGVSIWQMAVAPINNSEQLHVKQESEHNNNGYLTIKTNGYKDDDETSESEDDAKSDVINDDLDTAYHHIALARDDGCIQVYSITDSDGLTYYKSFSRVSGRALSLAWSPDAKFIYSGSSNGFIRCWDAKLGNEIYRITVGLGGLGSGSELCIWSLLALRCGTLVSADSSGSVQFWDCQHGTLLQAHSLHKGDVNTLATVPTHNRVFSAGSDGQVILYKLSSNKVGSSDNKSSSLIIKKWVSVGYVRAHTHDVRALAVAVPINKEDLLPDENIKKVRRRNKPIDFSYHKWAQLGAPMLLSAGDDTKLYAYSAKEFTKFPPHDICPAPQRLQTQMVLNTDFNKPLLLVQNSYSLDILCFSTKGRPASSKGHTTTDLLARVMSKASKNIICSTMSPTGAYFAYSDNVKPSLFELKKLEVGKNAWSVNKRALPKKLSYAHNMVFTSDSSRLILAGHDRKIHVVDVKSSELVLTLIPCRDQKQKPCEPPITKMFTSCDGQWLSAINCFGDIYVFNLDTKRQHWFISRLDGASVTAGGFSPHNNNVLILTTSLNQVYAFDVEAKQLAEWSNQDVYVLPKMFRECPGEVIGLSFSPSSSVIIYSARAMCEIDIGTPPIDQNNNEVAINGVLKRKLKDRVLDPNNLENFRVFKDPVLLVEHLDKNSILVIDKPWINVVRNFDARPVHKHIFGT